MKACLHAALSAACLLVVPAHANPATQTSPVDNPYNPADDGQFAVRNGFGPVTSDDSVRLGKAFAALDARDYARVGRLTSVLARPAAPEARYVAGLAQAGRGDLVAARRLLRAAVAGRRDFTEAETALALVHRQMGDAPAAALLRDRIAMRRLKCGTCDGASRLDKALALIDRAG
jgi:hypothetical protein